MQWVSNSWVWDQLGFSQSGSSSGLVVVFFDSRVWVLPCRVLGFGLISNLLKKEHSILEDVVVKIFFPKTSDYKFIIFRPWRTQIHQEINKSSSPFGDSPFT